MISKKDPHYGWELGNFFVSGYTDEITDNNENTVFLKNVGDKVTLWFKLKQNINGLNGNEKITVTSDNEGYDQYFETPKMKFGRGALIIRYTDHNNVKTEPTIYTNYLEANATVGADTKVKLFEEGDYEVALNYEITSDEFIDKIGHYRIFFKFSVRNSNCMVYPFDVKTGNELTNSAMTENGFKLDLAKSRYLKINIKKEVLKDSADGLVEDTRFNGSAKDGAEYTDEGIYNITVSNQYTGVFTTKKIYVGTNNIIRAHMTTGLPITEINKLIGDYNKIKVIGIYPNTDPGSYDILKAIDDNCSENIKFYKTLPREIFVNIMRNAKVLVGNSSMGILEAPFYKLPVVNIGNRQKGRLNAGNVEFVEYDKDQIKKSIEKAFYNKEYRDSVKNLQNPYGDGYAHKKIVDFLDKVDLNDRKWHIKRKLI